MGLLKVWNRWTQVLRYGLRIALLVLLIGRDSNFGLDITSRVRRFTRSDEFDFLAWTLEAVQIKLGQSSLGEQAYLSEDEQRTVVLDFFALQDQIAEVEHQIRDVYVYQSGLEADRQALPLRKQLNDLRARQRRDQPLAEAILQDQLAVVLNDLGLTWGGIPVPPVAFHFTPLPLALIVSPREVIRQDVNLDLNPVFSVDERAKLEQLIDTSLGVSSYVTPIGGIGTYPTMLGETGALNWAAEVGAHEWIHNFLTLRPLGLRYGESPELRTINETVASIAGKEIGEALIRRSYPEQAPTADAKPGLTEAAPPAFDFRVEMHETRVRVDQLLAEGKVDEAEQYMEERRQIFVQQGYLIRKLNQAYFAFFGAYADTPGATGADPVGPAVLELRQRSPSLAHFLKTIAWITSFEELQELLGRSGPNTQ